MCRANAYSTNDTRRDRRIGPHSLSTNDTRLRLQTYPARLQTGPVSSLLAPALSLHALQDDAECSTSLRLPTPAGLGDVYNVVRRVNRERWPNPHQYRGQNLAGARLVRPRDLPGEHLPHHDSEAVDIALVGGFLRVEHLRLVVP